MKKNKKKQQNILPLIIVIVLILILIFIPVFLSSNKDKKILSKNNKFGPLLGSLLGGLPQCGFSAIGANLYSRRVITVGTLIAIFLSTSDEMLPIMISQKAPLFEVLKIIGIKVIVGIVSAMAYFQSS